MLSVLTGHCHKISGSLVANYRSTHNYILQMYFLCLVPTSLSRKASTCTLCGVTEVIHVDYCPGNGPGLQTMVRTVHVLADKGDQLATIVVSWAFLVHREANQGQRHSKEGRQYAKREGTLRPCVWPCTGRRPSLY